MGQSTFFSCSFFHQKTGRSPSYTTPIPIVHTKGLWNSEPNSVHCVVVQPMGSPLVKFHLATFRVVLHKLVKKCPTVVPFYGVNFGVFFGLTWTDLEQILSLMLWRVLLGVDMAWTGWLGPLGGVGIGRGSHGSKSPRTQEIKTKQMGKVA